jgi:DNA-binding MarR family transcriptional regulator
VSGRDASEAFVQLEREIGLLLRRSRAISARLAGELHPDLDGAAYGLLSLLQDAGPLRASELVTRIGLDKSTVSRQVANLVDLGLVDRAADPVDGRAQVLTPSPEGAARLSRIRDVRRARWEEDLSDWPESDVATLADLLHRLNRIGDAREAEATRNRPTP